MISLDSSVGWADEAQQSRFLATPGVSEATEVQRH